MRNFPLHGFNKHLHRFRCSDKRKHLNLATRQNLAVNPLTTNALQDFQQLSPWFRSHTGLEHRRTQMRPEGVSGKVSTKRATEQHMHLNRNQTQRNRLNTLINFSLHGLNKHLPWFRCSGKGEYLNPAARQNPTFNSLTTNALQDFRKLYLWFRSQPGLEHRRTQMRPEGTSGRSIHQTRNRTAQASEPKPNSKKPPQHIDKLFVARLQQASPPVQMQRKKKYLNLTAKLKRLNTASIAS